MHASRLWHFFEPPLTFAAIMRKIGGLLLILTLGVFSAQDSTVIYRSWEHHVPGEILPADSVFGRAHVVVSYRGEQPVRIQHYGADGRMEAHVVNEYDSLGNHLVRREYYTNGLVKAEWRFRNNLEDIHLFRRIYGENFKPLNRNYIVNQEFNPDGRETEYAVRGAGGDLICHRATEYNESGRKHREILVDDLQQKTILERRYHYRDDDGRVTLEEFNGSGKLIQRVVLFDDDILPATY